MSSVMLVDGVAREGTNLELDCLSPGFAFGYGLFETAKFLRRQPVFYRQHFERIAKACDAAGLKLDLDEAECLRNLRELFRLNNKKEGIYKLFVFEDQGQIRWAMAIRDDLPSSSLEPIRIRKSKVVKSAAAFTSGNKTLNYFENWRELKDAGQHGFDDCFFCNESGFLTECSMRNFFWFSAGVLHTPSVECGLLNGVVRDVTLELAAESGILINEGAFRVEDLETAEAAFVTSSGSGIVPVREIQADSVHWISDSTPRIVTQLRERLIERELKDVEELA